MSPESSSSLYPDRPIRPLPKRRLRERLSPDVADNIQYPPAPQTVTPLFGYPYSSKEDLAALGSDSPNVAHRENSAGLGQEASFRRSGLGVDQDDHALLGQPRRLFVPRPLHDPPGHAIRTSLRQTQGRQGSQQLPVSTTSSVDGYDSFENSNNKKKRKIPTAGETILSGTHVLNDLGTVGVSSLSAGDEGSLEAPGVTSVAYQPGGSATGQGISGPGRGRYGRVRNGRSPLGVLSDANSIWGSRTPSKLRPGAAQYSSSGENSGIISTAIASAEKLPVHQGQEIKSLLHQEPSNKSSPNSSAQFTFTFDSQNPVSWPGSDPAPSDTLSSSYMRPTPLSQGYRDQYSSSSMRGSQGQSSSIPPLMASGGAQAGGHGNTAGDSKGTAQSNATPKKPKRRVNPLIQAAKQRRRETAYQNDQRPPSPEDIWICEFCEYERIFGRAPEALIRQYEVKDRQRRREEAERRRLLEKAKMKSRKGKKASKAPAKNNPATPNQQSGSSTGQQAPPPPSHPNDHDDDQTHHQTHGEDQDEDGDDSEGRDDDPVSEVEVSIPVPTIHRHGQGHTHGRANVRGDIGGAQATCCGY
ncbi:hypothetical protein GGR52DRAFT_572443 [Hypoxylon sp. FL1284]|nr:hypothetical protein GGR52DRAFT_572443 [Hypoxylon sp. FL1284]